MTSIAHYFGPLRTAFTELPKICHSPQNHLHKICLYVYSGNFIMTNVRKSSCFTTRISCGFPKYQTLCIYFLFHGHYITDQVSPFALVTRKLRSKILILEDNISDFIVSIFELARFLAYCPFLCLASYFHINFQSMFYCSTSL